MAAARCTWALLLVLPAMALAGGAGPVLLNRPFVTIWNAPTKACAEKFNVTLDLSVFDIVANADQDFSGDDVTLFYSNSLGLYPYYTSAGTPVDGGLPQNASLQAHLHQASSDIESALPSASYDGLAVIDWEAWRPLWARDWGAMNIYRQKSEELVRKEHPFWPSVLVDEVAKLEFEQSARAFMEQTLKLGEILRPDGYWGFYGFPDCYNNNFDSWDYTGACPLVEQARNRELYWLWQNSRALYPSIYLPQQLSGTDKVLSYVRNRVAEAFSVQEFVVDGSIPVLPYAQITFENTDDFLSEEDLVNTIGESAAQGAAGVVLWGSLSYSSSQEMCLKLKNYLDGDLGHYILNVTTSAELCSQKLCSGQGRCVRKENKEGFLHLDPFHFAIEKDSSQNHLEVHSTTSDTASSSKTAGTDSKTDSTDSKTDSTSSKTSSTDSQTSGSDSKTDSTDSKTSSSSSKTSSSSSSSKTSSSSSKTSSTDSKGKTSSTSGKTSSSSSSSKTSSKTSSSKGKTSSSSGKSKTSSSSSGTSSDSDASQLAEEFTCQCYDDWVGAHCDTKAA